jgi:hypothetical protein
MPLTDDEANADAPVDSEPLHGSSVPASLTTADAEEEIFVQSTAASVLVCADPPDGV